MLIKTCWSKLGHVQLWSRLYTCPKTTVEIQDDYILVETGRNADKNRRSSVRSFCSFVISFRINNNPTEMQPRSQIEYAWCGMGSHEEIVFPKLVFLSLSYLV